MLRGGAGGVGRMQLWSTRILAMVKGMLGGMGLSLLRELMAKERKSALVNVSVLFSASMPLLFRKRMKRHRERKNPSAGGRIVSTFHIQF